MWNIREIIKLGNKYHYHIDLDYFDGILIRTPNDSWIIKQQKPDRIRLYHANKKHGTGYHYQRHFKDGIHRVFAYISEHEQKPFRMNDKLFRIKELLNLHVIN